MCFSSKLCFDEKTEYSALFVQNHVNFVLFIVNFFTCTLVLFLSLRSSLTCKNKPSLGHFTHYKVKIVKKSKIEVEIKVICKTLQKWVFDKINLMYKACLQVLKHSFACQEQRGGISK